MPTNRYDAVIIGSGPAGLEAALNLKIRGKRFLLFGTPDVSRKVTAAARIDNYLGFPGISGRELQEKFLAHLEQMQIEILSEQVQMVYPMGEFFSLATAKDTYEATTVILAPGTFSAKLLPGEEELLGRGVSYCATCDAMLYRGKTAAVLGYTAEAAHEAEFLAEIADKVYYIPAGDVSLPEAPVEVLAGEVTAINGDGRVQTVTLNGRELPVDGVFILRDSVAHSSLVPGIALDNGFIKVDASMATSLPGCFAAGDCTGLPHQYMRAAGQGQTAALSAVRHINGMKGKRPADELYDTSETPKKKGRNQHEGTR